MKKNVLKKLFGGLLVTSIAVLALAGCGSGSDNGTDDSAAGGTEISGADSETLAVVIPAAEHGWLAGVAYYAEQKADDLGLDNVQIVTSSNVNDQTSQLDELISQKVGAIVLQPHTDEVSVAARNVVDADIPLVVFDRAVDADYDAYVAGSNPDIGTLSAEYLGDGLSGEGTIAVLNVPSSGSVSTDRVDAFKESMEADYPDIELVEMTAENFTQEAGLKAATDMLTANDEVDAIFSIDDESSLGILQAIKETGRSDIKFLSGAGGSQSYYKQIQSNEDIECFTATYSPSMIGDAMEVALKIMDGETVEKEEIVAPTIVTKDNVSDFLDSDSPY